MTSSLTQLPVDVSCVVLMIDRSISPSSETGWCQDQLHVFSRAAVSMHFNGPFPDLQMDSDRILYDSGMGSSEILLQKKRFIYSAYIYIYVLYIYI